MTIRIGLLPLDELDGLDSDTLYLAATISNGMYEANEAGTAFEMNGNLRNITELHTKFPSLKVKFYSRGTGLQGSPPPFAAIACRMDPTNAGLDTPPDPDTLILAWRGSKTLRDWFHNLLDFETTHMCAYANSDLAVQSGYNRLVNINFNKKGNDLINLINDNPIKRIIFTGHSLGGGLAQVAHRVVLAVRAGECTDAFLGSTHENMTTFASLIGEKGIEMRTIAFSAPMTTAVIPREIPLVTPIGNAPTVVENMTNFMLKDDMVPRAYGHVSYVDRCLAEIDFAGLPNLIEQGLDLLRPKLRAMVQNNIDILRTYQHVGRIVYYGDFASEPQVYTHQQFLVRSTEDMPDEDQPIPYQRLAESHVNTVRGINGFAWT